MPEPLHIQPFCLSDWMTNCYVVHPLSSDQSPTPCWIIDAGFEPQPLIQYIMSHNLAPACVMLTHAHVDHIAGLAEYRDCWPDLPILLHAAEHAFLTDPALNLSAVLDKPIVAPPATDALEEGQEFELAGAVFQLRHTPGHSPGGMTFYQPQMKAAIVGDTLFADSIGRTDFPGSDHATLMASIHKKLMSLPPDTRVFSGHGPETTIGRERQENPFLN